MSLFKSSLLAAAALALTLGTATAASAATPWDNHHPRRHQVIERVHREDLRIAHEHHEGGIAAMKAHRLHVAEHKVFHREQMEARIHHGHITKGEQHALNHRLNHLGKRIGG